jgi:hypothetical protein
MKGRRIASTLLLCVGAIATIVIDEPAPAQPSTPKQYALCPIVSNAQSASPATRESLAQGKRILLAAVNATGGDKLTAVKAVQMSETGKLISANGDTPLEVKWTVQYPYHSHGDVTYGGQPVVQICNGTTAWIVMGGQVHDVTARISEFERGIALFGGGWGLYREFLAGKVTADAIGETDIDGKKTLGVAIQAPFGNIKLFFDPATHRLTAARYPTATQEGTVEAEQRWSDYRPIEGFPFAFVTITYRGGMKYFESSVREAKLNPGVDESLFAKPETAPAK